MNLFSTTDLEKAQDMLALGKFDTETIAVFAVFDTETTQYLQYLTLKLCTTFRQLSSEKKDNSFSVDT